MVEEQERRGRRRNWDSEGVKCHYFKGHLAELNSGSIIIFAFDHEVRMKKK